MSREKRIVVAMVVSWISRIVAAFGALLLVPILFRYMPKEDLGVWYLLGSGQAFVGLFGFGLAPVLTRHIALLVKSSHIDEGTTLGDQEKVELDDLLYTGQIALRWMAVATMICSWVIGYFLIRRLPLEHLSFTTVFWVWTLMCVGWSSGVWMSYLDCWVAGIGFVGSDTFITMLITSGTTLASVTAVVVWHGRIVSLAWIAFISVVVQRFVLVAFLRKRGIWRGHLPGKWSRVLANRLVKPSIQCWITILGTFLIYKTDQYFIALYLGTSHVALYQSTYNTMFALAIAANAATSSVAVFASQMWAEGRIEAVHRFLVRGCRIGFVILMSGELFLATSGKPFFLILLKGAFVGYPVLLVLMLTLALDTQHGLLSNVSRATDDEVYAIPAITGGLLNLIFTWVLIRRIGLIGVVTGTLIAQVLTNNWYAVYRPLHRLKFSFKHYVLQVLVPIALYTGASAAVVFSLKWLAVQLWGTSLGVSFASGLTATCVTGLAGLWIAFKGLRNTPLAPLTTLWSPHVAPAISKP